jgi:hypothetical protein
LEDGSALRREVLIAYLFLSHQLLSSIIVMSRTIVHQ